MGYLWALLGIVCIGSYMLPVRFSTTKGFSFFYLMGFGFFPVVILRWSSVRLLWAHPMWLGAALFSGVLWGLGQIAANLALEEISLAKAVVYFNFNTLLNIFLGLIFFNEATGMKSTALLLAGAALLVAGAIWVTKIPALPSKEGNLKKGVILSLLAGLFWGVYFFPVTWVRHFDSQASPSIGQTDVLIGLVLGGLITALGVPLFAKIKKPAPLDLALGFGSAFLWAAGMSGMLMSIQLLGLSRAVPIVNSNALVYTAWSLFVFKEIHFSEWPKVLGSVLLVLGGGVLMALSN
jgi:glucose uptake protein GlcU